jgi:hypothetical protein
MENATGQMTVNKLLYKDHVYFFSVAMCSVNFNSTGQIKREEILGKADPCVISDGNRSCRISNVIVTIDRESKQTTPEIQK